MDMSPDNPSPPHNPVMALLPMTPHKPECPWDQLSRSKLQVECRQARDELHGGQHQSGRERYSPVHD